MMHIGLTRITSGARRGAMAALLGLAALLSGSSARADLIDTLVPPDIDVFFITVSYDATTDTLTAIGFPDSLLVPPDNAITGPSTLNLTAQVDAAGTLLSGSFTITGTIPALGFNSGTLLIGTLTAMEPVGGEIIEFLFDATGGDAESLYDASGFPGGIILAGTGYPGSFATSWTNDDDGRADVGVAVPEPGALTSALVGLGLAGAGAAVRRRKQNA